MCLRMLIHWYLCDITVTSPMSMLTRIRLGLIIVQLHHAHIYNTVQTFHGHDRKETMKILETATYDSWHCGWTVKYICVWGCVHVWVCWGIPHNTSEGIANVVNLSCTPFITIFRFIYKQYIKIEEEYMVGVFFFRKIKNNFEYLLTPFKPWDI